MTNEYEHDVFISHASEDKDDFVRPLAQKLIEKGYRVWYDEFSLTVGDSFSSSIDKGLSESKFGIIVLSPNFISKSWTKRELAGLVQKEIRFGKVILPIWHKVTYQQVFDFSLTLADKLAANTSQGLDNVVNQIVAALTKEGIKISTTRQQEYVNSTKETISEELIGRYLNWLIEQYGELELPGLPQGERRPAVNLDTVYVALRGDLSNPHERMQSQLILEQQARQIENLLAVETLTPEQQFKIIYRTLSLLTQAPLPLSIEERDRPQLFHKKYEKTITLGEAFQTERRLVILGDPGSGKTTLSRWLTLKLAQSFLKKEESVKVPLHQVDPVAEPTPDEIDLGPSRVPILMRIATFANERKQNPQRRLAEFIGHHLGKAYGDQIADSQGKVIDTFQLNQLLLSLLESGKAVVILDGLDEIDDPGDRYDIVREIDRFINANLPESGLTLSSDGQKLKLDLIGNPCESGGNQVIVTSRIVGYQMAPLSNNATHLTIEPMKKSAVNRFCEVWIEAIHRVSMPPEKWNKQTTEIATKEAEGLKAAITELEEKGAGEIATNPLLITILALVFRYGKASFPKQRVELYKTAVSILIEKWRQRAKFKGQRELAEQDILNILVPLAADIHENSSIGIVDEERLKKVLEQHLSPSDVTQFKQVLEEEVGLLTARGQRVYGFLHLTFQEYLAACWLIRDKNQVGERLLEKLNAPRWREPILMAVGKLSAELDESTLQTLLLRMLTKEDSIGNLLPRAALLLVAALPEMSKIPTKVVEEIGNQLLNVYANHETTQRFPLLCKQIEQAFIQLFEKEYSRQIERVLYKALTEENPLQSNRILAAATLIRNNRHYTIELCEALASALVYDSEKWNFPIDRSLRDIVAYKPDLFPNQQGTLRLTLLQKPDLAQRFLADPAWIRIGIIIYGGFDSRLSEKINLVKEKIAQLNLEQKKLSNNPTISQFQEKNENLNNEIAEWNKKLTELKEKGNQFTIKQIYRDSPLTPLILSTLKAERSAYSLIPELWKLWQGENNYLDAFLALIALGETITPILKENSTLTQNVISHFSKFTQDLGLAIQAEIKGVLLERLANKCPWEHWLDLISATKDLSFGFEGEPSSFMQFETVASEEVKSIVIADSWSYFFSNNSDDKFYNFCVVLDTIGKDLSEPPIKLAKGLALVHQSVNQNWNGDKTLDIVKLTPRASEEIDILTTALDTIIAMPNEPFDFVKGWALMRLAPLLKNNGLLPEAVIITLSSLSNRFNTRVETMQVIGEQDASYLPLLTNPYPAFDLLKIVQKIKDNHLRCRGYLQLMRYFPTVRSQLLIEKETSKLSVWRRLTNDVQSYYELSFNGISIAIQNIKDFNQQAWMFEQLASFGNQKQQQQCLKLAYQAAWRIPDPDNCARALTRLTEYFSSDECDKMLDYALKKIEKISNQRQRAETIALLRKSIIKYPQFHLRFQQIVSHLNEPCNQWKARGVTAPLLQHYETQLLEIGFNTTTIILGSIIKDIQQEFEQGTDITSLWWALTTRRKPAALQELCNQGKSNGLRLTKEAITVLNQLLKIGELTTVHQLLPLIQDPEPTIIPLVKRWLTHPNRIIQRHANLLLAETEGFSKQTLPTLIELLTEPEDRIRYRAALVLYHGSFLYKRLLTTNYLGEETLIMLSRYAIQFYDKEPQISQVLGWSLEKILHNDGQIIENLSKIVTLNSSNSDEAKKVLANIQHIDSNTWSVFLKELQVGTFEVQLALFRSICILLYHNRISEKMWNDVLPILKELNSEIVAQQEFVLDGPGTLVEAVEVAWQEIQENGKTTLDIVTTAETVFHSKHQKLTAVLQQESNSIRKTLTELGSVVFVGEHYRNKIITAAEHLDKNPSLLEILIDWLEKRLRTVQAISDKSYYFNYTDTDLLCVVAAGAERFPNTFYNKANTSELLEQRLREVVEFHSTFPGRQAAIALLSFLRRITPKVTAAVQAGLQDVVDVQETVFQTLTRYRDVESDFLSQIFKNLLHSSPSMGFATAKMLAAIGNNIYLPPQIRDLMIAELVNAINNPQAHREVYLLVKEEITYNPNGNKIKYMGRLDELFYQIVIQLSGIADIGKYKKQSNNKEKT